MLWVHPPPLPINWHSIPPRKAQIWNGQVRLEKGLSHSQHRSPPCCKSECQDLKKNDLSFLLRIFWHKVGSDPAMDWVVGSKIKINIIGFLCFPYIGMECCFPFSLGTMNWICIPGWLCVKIFLSCLKWFWLIFFQTTRKNSTREGRYWKTAETSSQEKAKFYSHKKS